MPVKLSATFGSTNQANLLKFFKPKSSDSGLIYLRAQQLENRKWTDAELAFRQETNFFYLTGCHQPEYQFTLDPATKKATLYIPDYEADHTLWSGPSLTVEEVKSMYHVSACFSASMLASHLENYKTVHVIDKAELPLVTVSSKLDDSTLRLALEEARVFKSDEEVSLMRLAGKISAEAHIAVMKAAKTYAGKSEQYFSALFAWECAKKGGKFQAYGSIVGAGVRGAILHSSPLASPITSSPQDLCLVDAGCEIHCYASDITRTFPFGGVYSDEYKVIYQLTLDANKAVIASMKPGVKWEDMHRLAEQVILKGLIKANIVQGSEEELKKNNIAALFFPHGLGHLLGLDVHDSSRVSYPKGVERIPEPGIKYLRMRRNLEVGMVITVEPGIYFVDAILDPAITNPAISKFLNLDVLKQYRKVGGVRIEDDVLIKADGLEIFSSGVPKEISEIEEIMASN